MTRPDVPENRTALFTPQHYLRSAMAPRSLAVVGASERSGALGAAVFGNIRAGTFAGPVYPVNPKYPTLDGLRCHARLADLPEAPDLAVVVTPAATAPGLIDAAGDLGIRNVLVLSAGFAESGPQGKALQDDLLARARVRGVRVLGPNCLGLMRPGIGLNASFARTPARPGSVALVSQSGAIVAALLDHAWAAGFGFSSVVSTGAGVDIEFAEILDFLALDADTHSIVLYVEGVHDARGLLSSVRAAASAKPVVVLKVGRHLTGSTAAMSHTGALVGNDAVFDGALRRVGAIRVDQYDQLFAAAQTLATGRLPRGPRLAILTNGGGPGVIAADWAADSAQRGAVRLATLSSQTRERLDAFLPPTWPHANPVDVIGDADEQRFAQALEALLADPENDGVLLLYCPTLRLTALGTARALLPVIGATAKPVVSAWLGEADAALGRTAFDKAGVPALASPERGVEAFGYLARFVAHRELRLQVPPPHVDEFDHDLAGARRIIEAARTDGRHVLDEAEAKQLLACFGLPIARTQLATRAEDAVRAAQRIGYPVVLKVLARGVTHKTDVGGVLLDIADDAAVAQGFETIRTRLAERMPQAQFVGVLVQALVHRPHGRELLCGLARDASFGPVLSFGLGGVAVEVLRDAAVALPPLNRLLARDLVSRTRAAKLLDAFRGWPAADLDAVIDVLLRLSDLACELPCVRELDINPLLADEHGVTVLDARVVVDDGALAPDARFGHLAIHPYPRGLEQPVRLRDGSELLLRPIRPEDGEAERRFVARLSPQSMYLRFHAPLKELSLERLVRFTQIDYDREMAFVAVARDAAADADPPAIRGVARYTRNPDGRSAEFGIVVEDAWQGRGLGQALLDALEACARSRGIAALLGYVLHENHGMHHLMRARGYRGERDADDAEVIRFVLVWPAADELTR